MEITSIHETLVQAVQQHLAGQLTLAEQLYREALAQDPNQPDALHYLGTIAHQARRHDLAIELIARAVAIRPDYADAHTNLGNALSAKGRVDEAIAAYRTAIALKPDGPDAHNNLGNCLAAKGWYAEAIAAYRQAITFKPNYPEAFSNLGSALKENGQPDEAIAAYRQAIALKPRHPEAYNNLGIALRKKGQLDEAIAAYRQAIALNPDFPEACNNLGSALQDSGRLDEGIAAYRRACALKPDYNRAHSNVIFALHFHHDYDARAIADELRRWDGQHAEPLKKLIRPHRNDRNPERPLRVGYVSADFRDHASAHFLVPLFERHDPRQVELFCYAEVSRPDETTRHLRQRARQWRSTVGLSDAQIAEQVRDDQIDILMDLKLHTARNRLMVFARKPAPVQVTWLGYPGSTGLSTMDYRLSDPYLDPPGMDESIYSERTIRLPDSFWCYDPLDGREIPVSALPASASGRVTFGSLNNFNKINDDTLKLWAAVMRGVRDSRMLLLAPEGGDCHPTLDQLRREGVDPDRIEFVPRMPRREYLRQYHRIDLALDCYPVNGHTTSLDSLWMGVPIVTLVGENPMSRAGWCQLSNLKLTELAADTPERFVSIAVELANDLPRLQALRSSLRGRMEQSPLMDAPRFARNVEAAYRQMWRKWCDEGNASVEIV